MRNQAFLLSMLFLVGCATLEHPKPLTSDEVIGLARSGKNGPQIIEELKRTDTVIPLTASEILRLSAAGVPTEVLDYLQRAQIEEIRWRDRYSQMYWYGPLYRGYSYGFGPCPWPYPPGVRRPYYGGPWGC